MISSIFYFADTEQEYLDNFNAHQVKPYTIVFCRDTRTLWKNGVKYGGGDASEVVTTIQSQINDAISAFEQRVNEGSACTTISNRINGAEDIIAEFIAKVTNDSSSASITSKLNSLSGGVVTNANLEYAVSYLFTKQEPIITLTCVSESDNSIETLNANPGSGDVPSDEYLPASIENLITAVGDTVTLTGTQFNELFANMLLYAFSVEQSLGYDEELGELIVSRPAGADLKYESTIHGLQNNSYYVSDGEYLRNAAGYIIKISVKDLRGEIFSTVDQKIGTATAGLAAKSYVNGKEASILAQVANDISNITITADNITFNTAFVNALSAVAAFDTVIAQKVQAQTINANTISAAKTYNVDNTICQSHTVIDGDGVRLYNGKDDHIYDSNDEDTDYANSVLKNDGSGHLANGNITWEEDGSVHIGPNGSDGIYIYDDNGTTKIKLQGDIVTNGLNLKDTESQGQDGLMIKGKGTRSLRQIDTYIGPSGINANLQTFTSYSNGPSNNHGDFILPQNYPSLVETGDNNNGYTVHDWGAISICNSIGNVPNPKNSYAESHNDMINSKRLSPGTTLVVKGFDGRGYKGYTGVSQANASLCFINGICIGPASEIRNSATYDSDYNLSVDGNTLH